MEVPGFSRGLSPSAMSLRAWRGLLHDLLSLSVILQSGQAVQILGKCEDHSPQFPQEPKGKTAVTHPALEKEQLPSPNLVI